MAEVGAMEFSRLGRRNALKKVLDKPVQKREAEVAEKIIRLKTGSAPSERVEVKLDEEDLMHTIIRTQRGIEKDGHCQFDTQFKKFVELRNLCQNGLASEEHKKQFEDLTDFLKKRLGNPTTLIAMWEEKAPLREKPAQTQ